MLKVSLWEKIQSILIALKVTEKQKNNESRRGYYIFQTGCNIFKISVVVFFSLKYVAIWGMMREHMCVAGGFNQLDKTHSFSPAGLGPVRLGRNRKVCV